MLAINSHLFPLQRTDTVIDESSFIRFFPRNRMQLAHNEGKELRGLHLKFQHDLTWCIVCPSRWFNTKPDCTNYLPIVKLSAVTMMNSVAADDGDYPPNPFRPQQQVYTNDYESDVYDTPSPAPSFAQPRQHQQYATATPLPAPCDPYPYTTTPQTIPSGSMNSGSASQPTSQSRWASCMACFHMSTYTAYFDVDTVDIRDRLKGSVTLFYFPDKFRSEVIGSCRSDSLKGPDLYGPLWITMTLVFFVAVRFSLVNSIDLPRVDLNYSLIILISIEFSSCHSSLPTYLLTSVRTIWKNLSMTWGTSSEQCRFVLVLSWAFHFSGGWLLSAWRCRRSCWSTGSVCMATLWLPIYQQLCFVLFPGIRGCGYV